MDKGLLLVISAPSGGGKGTILQELFAQDENLRPVSYTHLVNISLAVFNLIPLPPLDGSRIVAAFLSDRAMYLSLIHI